MQSPFLFTLHPTVIWHPFHFLNNHYIALPKVICAAQQAVSLIRLQHSAISNISAALAMDGPVASVPLAVCCFLSIGLSATPSPQFSASSWFLAESSSLLFDILRIYFSVLPSFTSAMAISAHGPNREPFFSVLCAQYRVHAGNIEVRHNP